MQFFSQRFCPKRDLGFFRLLKHLAFNRQRIHKEIIYNNNSQNPNIIRFFKVLFHFESIKIICLHAISGKSHMSKTTLERKEASYERL